MTPRRCSETVRLVADIGGTHIRLGLSTQGQVVKIRTLLCAEYESVSGAAREYLSQVDPGSRPCEAVLAAAGPLLGNRIRMTNHVWSISIPELREDLNLERVLVLNDFEALARSLPELSDQDLKEIKTGIPEKDKPMAVIGPGTGLGVAALVPARGSWVALPTEGGHREISPVNDREWSVTQRLRQRFGHVSAERALSGPGLVNLYEAICRLDGKEPLSLTPAGVDAGARSGNDPACIEAHQLFASWLGSLTGDLALTLGARGGIFIGGGVIPRMGRSFDLERFQQRFLDRGRFGSYVEPIPIHLIVHRHAALLGAAQALSDQPGSGRILKEQRI